MSSHGEDAARWKRECAHAHDPVEKVPAAPGRRPGAVVTLTLATGLVWLLGTPLPPAPAGGPEQENPAAPHEWMWAQRANPGGAIPATAYRDALAQAQRLELETARAAPQLANARWELLGPANPGGRLIDLVIDPAAAGTVFVAAWLALRRHRPGVFDTPNRGRTWLKVGKSFPAVPVNDLHLHADSGTLFAATFGRSILTTSISNS